MQVLIKVTNKIIQESQNCGFKWGGKGSSTNCAIALAIRTIWPDATVGPFSITLIPFKESIKLRGAPTKFIIAFDKSTPDERLKMSPFEFEVEIDPDKHLTHLDSFLEAFKRCDTMEIATP